MKKAKFVILAICLCAAGAAQAGTISVVNPSFEVPVLPAGVQTTNWNDQQNTGTYVITGWSYDYTAGSYDRDTGVFRANAGTPPDGTTNAAFVYHRTALDGSTGPWQDLGHPIVAGMTYTFTMDVQRRSNGSHCSLTFNYHDGGTRTEIIENRIVMSGQANNSWATYSVSFAATEGEPYIGKTLGIEFNNESSGESWQHFDNARVTEDIVVSVDPADGAVSVSQNVTLQWSEIADAVSYNVYLSINPNDVDPDGPGPLMTPVNVATNSYTPPPLDAATLYYWRVDTILPGPTIIEGFMNTFTTGGKGINPFPADGAISVATDGLVLLWSGQTEDIGSWDVYFGDTYPPTFQANISTTQWQAPAMADDTTYYWKVNPRKASDGTLNAVGDDWSFTTGALIAHWPMNDGNDIVSGYTGIVLKDPGDSNSVPDHNSLGVLGNCVEFDGNCAYSIADDANTMPAMNVGMTAAFWARFDGLDPSTYQVNKYARFIGKYSKAVNTNGWVVGTYSYYGSISNELNGDRLYNLKWIADDQWHHIVFTYDNATRRIYLDGALEMERAHAGPIKPTPGVDIRMGSYYDDLLTRDVYNGYLDEVKLYTKPLSADQVATLCAELADFASTPTPANGQRDVSTNTTLTWHPGQTAGIANQKLYFGTIADFSDAVEYDLSSTATATYDIVATLGAALDPGQTYYWRVDTVDGSDDVIRTGETWSFTIEALPGDVDGDKVVNLNDVTEVAAAWLHDSKTLIDPNSHVIEPASGFTNPDLAEPSIYFDSFGPPLYGASTMTVIPTTDPNAHFTPTSTHSLLWSYDPNDGGPTDAYVVGTEVGFYLDFKQLAIRDWSDFDRITFWFKPTNMSGVSDDSKIELRVPFKLSDGTEVVSWGLAAPNNDEAQTWAAQTGKWTWIRFTIPDYWEDIYKFGITFGCNPGPASIEIADIALSLSSDATEPSCWDGVTLSAADINKDCVVNLYDLAEVAADWLQDLSYKMADFNNDGDVDLIDFSMLAEDWRETGTYLTDITGPIGTSDGTVDMYDLVQLASEWLK